MIGAATPFLTVPELKSFLATNYPDGSAEDLELEALISAACNAIERHMQRPVIARAVQAVSDGGLEKVMLVPTVTEIISVVEGGALLSEGDYAVYPDVAYIVRRSGGSLRPWKAGVQSVVIWYKTGVAVDYQGVPDNLKLAAKILVKFYLMNGPGDFGSTLREGSMMRPDMVPKQVLWLLDTYRVVG